MNYNSERTLNIFCDASITTAKDGTVIGCPGSIAIDKNKGMIDYSFNIIERSTNNNSEITAVLLAVYQAYKFRDLYDEINIFSDSKICIFGLREWIFNWVHNMVNGVMYSSSGTPVANQEIIITIYNFIVSNNLKVNFYHQKGHVTGTDKSIMEARRVFAQSNRLSMSMEFIETISFHNNWIDAQTKAELDQYIYNRDTTVLTKVISYEMNPSHISIYKKLIGRK